MILRRIALTSLIAFSACAPDGDVQATSAALRPDEPGVMPPAYATTDVVESFLSPGGGFAIHITRTGMHAVPPLDTNTDGTPDFVAAVADQYDAVASFFADNHYHALPSDEALPNNGGDARFDVYLLDFGTSADGSFRSESCDTATPTHCIGYISQENDFNGRPYPGSTGVRILASHELFHAVQATYDSNAGSNVQESTAVMSSEDYDVSLGEVESFAEGYFARGSRSLDQEPTGPVDPYSYGLSVVFEGLVERHDASLIHDMWEEIGAGTHPGWLSALDAVLMTRGSSFADEMIQTAQWNYFTAGRADPLRGYARGAQYPLVTEVDLPLPGMEPMVRSFHAAIRYYRADVSGRPRLAAQTIGMSQDGLTTLMALESANRITMMQTAPGGQRLELDANGATTLHVAVVDTRLAGSSIIVGLCTGTPEEVDACSAQLSGMPPDAGVVSTDAGPTMSGGGGCCSAVAHGGHWPYAIFLVIAGLRARARGSNRRASSHKSTRRAR